QPDRKEDRRGARRRDHDLGQEHWTLPLEIARRGRAPLCAGHTKPPAALCDAPKRTDTSRGGLYVESAPEVRVSGIGCRETACSRPTPPPRSAANSPPATATESPHPPGSPAI